MALDVALVVQEEQLLFPPFCLQAVEVLETLTAQEALVEMEEQAAVEEREGHHRAMSSS